MLEFLLRRGEEEMTRRTLDSMALGGMYDVVGGGFHRYSVDERWLVPHFEKMLYDNALLASVYLHAARRFGDERYRRVADLTLDYVLRELALDGRRLRLGAGRRHRTASRASRSPGRRAKARPRSCSSRSSTAASCCAASSTRRPACGCSRCARSGRSRCATTRRSPRGTGCCSRRSRRAAGSSPAIALAEFLLGPLSTPEGRLHRTWRDGVAKGTGYLEDYADVAYGLMELHVASGEPRWLLEAHRLATLAIDLFADDEAGGFFQTPRDGEQLVARKKELDDHPTPSGNAMIAYVLLRLARIWGDDELERRGVSVLRLVRDSLARAPSAFGWLLVALDQHLAPHRELAIVGAARCRGRRAAPRRAAPTDVIAFGPAARSRCSPDAREVDGRAAVYLCERFACRLPVTEPERLRRSWSALPIVAGTSRRSAATGSSASTGSYAGTTGAAQARASHRACSRSQRSTPIHMPRPHDVAHSEVPDQASVVADQLPCGSRDQHPAGTTSTGRKPNTNHRRRIAGAAASCDASTTPAPQHRRREPSSRPWNRRPICARRHRSSSPPTRRRPGSRWLC